MTIFLNGQYLEESEGSIPISDRGFLFGDGVFTTAKVKNGQVEFYEDHCERLKQDLCALGIAPPELKIDWIEELIRRNKAEAGSWRLKIVITGGSSRELNLNNRSAGILLMTLKPYQELKANSVALGLFSRPIARPVASIKSLSYIDRLYVRHEAESRGFYDSIVLNGEGCLLETAFSNLFWRIGKELFAPDFPESTVSGVALKQILKKAQNLGIPVHLVRTKWKDLPGNAEVFICNCLIGAVSVHEIEGKTFQSNSGSSENRALPSL
jgi:4-amino-4-deoxychorismate lyase